MYTIESVGVGGSSNSALDKCQRQDKREVWNIEVQCLAVENHNHYHLRKIDQLLFYCYRISFDHFR